MRIAVERKLGNVYIVLIVAREQKKLPFLREVIGITAPLLLIEDGIFRRC